MNNIALLIQINLSSFRNMGLPLTFLHYKSKIPSFSIKTASSAYKFVLTI